MQCSCQLRSIVAATRSRKRREDSDGLVATSFAHNLRDDQSNSNTIQSLKAHTAVLSPPTNGRSTAVWKLYTRSLSANLGAYDADDLTVVHGQKRTDLLDPVTEPVVRHRFSLGCGELALRPRSVASSVWPALSARSRWTDWSSGSRHPHQL